MQWLTLALWGTICIRARTDTRATLFKLAYTAAVAASMLVQLRLLYIDSQLTLGTGLPLHLCGLMGVLSPALIWLRPAWLFELSYFLGAPCALLTLFFPAVIVSSRPQLMLAAFCRLHALVALAPLFLLAQGSPPPRDPRRAFVIANAYLLLVGAFNMIFNTNYLFLRRAPAGTPLEPLMRGGIGAYVLALELGCILLMTLMREISAFYLRKYESIYPV